MHLHLNARCIQKYRNSLPQDVEFLANQLNIAASYLGSSDREYHVDINASTVDEALFWEESPQGNDFWYYVDNMLLRSARRCLNATS